MIFSIFGRRTIQNIVKEMAGECRPKTIGTHNGTFHCDEALACAMLRLLPEWSNATIVRTRDSQVLATCDIVVDVGGVYDPKTHRYDHHQRTFTETMSSVLAEKRKPWQIKLSSAGLVFAHFGHRVVKEVTQTDSEGVVELLFDKIYENFMIEVDAIDNGVDICPKGVTAQYAVHTNLSSRVSRLNTKWNDKYDDEAAEQDRRFQGAVDLVGREFVDCVRDYHTVWLPAREVVLSALSSSDQLSPCGQIIQLATPSPWKDHLFTVEKQQGVEGRTKYVLYEDTTNNNWRIQAVPVSTTSFENRLSLPPDWCGLRDAELSATCGVPDCIFVHSSGFIGGNKTRDGVLRMARLALDRQRQTSG